jgi:hypothetical protein
VLRKADLSNDTPSVEPKLEYWRTVSEQLRRLATCGVCALALMLVGCSIRSMAINTLGSALAEGTSTFAKDDDPELVRDAVPFALKTIESLIEQSPKHRGLLLAACSGQLTLWLAFVGGLAATGQGKHLTSSVAAAVVGVLASSCAQPAPIGDARQRRRASDVWSTLRR